MDFEYTELECYAFSSIIEWNSCSRCCTIRRDNCRHRSLIAVSRCLSIESHPLMNHPYSKGDGFLSHPSASQSFVFKNDPFPFKNNNSIASSKMQSKILHNFNKILFYLPSSLHCSSVIIHQISGFMLVNLARVRLHNAILRIESPRDCIPIKSWRVPIENCHHGETVHDDHYQRGLIKGPTVV